MHTNLDSAATTEIIAVVLPDGTPTPPNMLDDCMATGTMLLVRHADGRMALEPVRRAAALRTATADCVYKSKPIHDPVSREIIGYELEMLSPTRLC